MIPDPVPNPKAAVEVVFPGVVPSPYLMTGASDCRYFSRGSPHFAIFHGVLDLRMSKISITMKIDELWKI